MHPPLGTGRPDADPIRSELSSTEAQRRLIEFGSNEIHREKGTSALALFARQFGSPVIWLLLGACVLSAALGEMLDAEAGQKILEIARGVGVSAAFDFVGADSTLELAMTSTRPAGRVVQVGLAGGTAHVTALKTVKPEVSVSVSVGQHPRTPRSPRFGGQRTTDADPLAFWPLDAGRAVITP